MVPFALSYPNRIIYGLVTAGDGRRFLSRRLLGLFIVDDLCLFGVWCVRLLENCLL